MEKGVNLYECVLYSKIHDLSAKTEYLRCENEKILKLSFEQGMASTHGIYAGYYKVTIRKITIDDFPEVRVMSTSTSPTNYSQAIPV